jgi:hypothetical protein
MADGACRRRRGGEEEERRRRGGGEEEEEGRVEGKRGRRLATPQSRSPPKRGGL